MNHTMKSPGSRNSGGVDSARIIMLGAAGVGKSALVVRYLTGRFIWEYDPTLECTYKQQTIVDEEGASIEILDTAGQSLESVNSLHTESQIQWAEGFIIVYSVTDRQSFELARDLKQAVDDVKSPRAPYSCLLVANKCDLEAGRQVSTSAGEQLATELGCGFMETSAAAPSNFSELLDAVHDVYRDVRRRKLMECKPATVTGARRRSSVHQQVSHVFNKMLTKIQNG